MRIIDDKIVFVSEQPTDKLNWGYYQFPKFYREKDGKIYLHISTNLDLQATEKRIAGTLAFCSDDEGQTFTSATDFDEKNATNYFYIGDVLYGFPKRENVSSQNIPKLFEETVGYGYYGGVDLTLHPFESIPDKVQNILCSKIENGKEVRYCGALSGVKTIPAIATEITGFATVNPNILYTYDSRRCQFLISGEEWFAAICEPIGECSQYIRYQRTIVKSEDKGVTWKKICVIYPDDDMPYGFPPETAFEETSDGRLVLVCRTHWNHNVNSLHYLAHYTSDDRGVTWTKQPSVIPFSVTPMLMRGENEIAVIYGRPGVYCRTSKDGIHWSDSITIVGIDEKDIPSPLTQEFWNENHHKYTCGNTSVIRLSNNNYLLAYSDFMHSVNGENHKAIHVATIQLD